MGEEVPPPGSELGSGWIETAIEDPNQGAGSGGPLPRSHLTAVARGGLINLVGAVAAGILNFVLVVLITRGLGTRGAGAFFVALAMFSLLSNTLELGADTGLVRTISRLRALGRVHDLRRTLLVALVPVLAGSAAAAVAMYGFAPKLASVFTHSHPGPVTPLVRVLAFFLPISAAYTVVVAATRGFGTMVPSVIIDRLGKPALQPLLVLLVVLAGLSTSTVMLAWACPIGLGFVAAALWLSALLRRAERKQLGTDLPSPLARLASDFWRFTAPRGLAGFFQVSILWADTLLIGALSSTREAGIYAAATRYMLVGSFAILAILQVTGPKISELIARREHDSALSVYQVSTSWLVLMTWPVYLTIILFAPVLLSVFGHGFLAGEAPLVIIALSMLVATACGPVDVVLLMAGKSSWNLVNTLIALVLNIGLNFLLIPHLGITGAGVAWAVSILANNLLPLAQSWRYLQLHPFGAGFPKAALAAGVAYAGVGAIIRFAIGATIPGFVLFAALSTVAYLTLIWWFRDSLELRVLREALRARTRGRGNHRTASIQP